MGMRLAMMEIKIVAAQILKRMRFVTCDKTEVLKFIKHFLYMYYLANERSKGEWKQRSSKHDSV